MLKALVVAGLIAACFGLSVAPGVAAQVHSMPAHASKMMICPDIYLPVCGSVGGQRQTFPNSCDARRAGAGSITAGACQTRPIACPRIYQPVCAQKGRGNRQTYANACTAEMDGATVVSNGKCPSPRPGG
jgi:Kazal-type serine protease inhibitor domain